MRLTIFGSGYVGLVTAACFADRGNHVLCVDISRERVRALSRGKVPFYEPGLADLLKRNARGGRLRFTTDAREGVAHGELIMLGGYGAFWLVALLGIDRCLDALPALVAEDNDPRLPFLQTQLARLRTEVETRFPAARAFVCAGLDTEPVTAEEDPWK